ncbi:uncharacterized protein I206_102925 [Kwoniella pini CBS 10737]|uniref:Transcription initiation factor TFIID subunit 4 n=1 Tax=Kwoniella pini CBS 10737 TaxID=1296096 RepID=A0A1B9I6R7_9TREE|nr:uncharacterized protein I206_03276 [Kwoniella pini CBS 10737]OCF51210.1 hypothetical protein I206_03276 [Kwoniella pini CBS 10737]
MQKTKGDTFDLRAEEDAARRLNVGKAINTNSFITGLNSRAKRTDLIGKPALKEKVDAIAKDHGVTFDPEVSLYLLSTIEERIKSLLQSAIKAQQHRTNSSHLRQPPLNKKDGRAIWNQKIINDPNSVMDSVNKLYREEEQEFRKLRMNRLAKEAELQKIKERVGTLQQSDNFDELNGGPSTPLKSFSNTTSSSFNTPISSSSNNNTPMFGAIKESNIKKNSKTSLSSTKLNPRDVSAEVQHKMANATAMRSVGMGKKYGWMTGNVPTISSPLANNSSSSKKRKLEKEKSSSSSSKLKETLISQNSNTPPPSTPTNNGNENENFSESERSNKKLKPIINLPTRRLILIDKKNEKFSASSGIGIGEENEEKRIEDDKVLTLVDLTFALEHNGLGGNGIGNEDEILKNIWARRGGPWGEDGWDGKK